jgi:hypothetical protein
MRQYYSISRDAKLLKFSGFIRDDSAKEANFAHFIVVSPVTVNSEEDQP